MIPRPSTVIAALVVLTIPGCQGASVPDRDIVYTSATEVQSEQIWMMRPDGSDGHPVTPAVEGLHDSFAVWSPDGTSIAFMSNRHLPGEQAWAIFTMDADGTNIRRVGPEQLAFQAAPDFSPDGTRIVFSGGATMFAVDLYVMNVDGSDLRRLTNLKAFVSCARWSPDGRKVLFSRNIDELRVVEIETGQVSEILPPNVEGGCGDWSPDGSKVAFSSGPDGQLPSLQEMNPARAMPQELYVLDLTNGALSHFPQAGPQSNYPRWSRDGRRIVFQCPIPPGGARDSEFTGSAGIFEICVMNADGSDIRPITNNSVLDVHPNW